MVTFGFASAHSILLLILLVAQRAEVDVDIISFPPFSKFSTNYR